LDCIKEGIANFHLVFLARLARYLGFEANGDNIDKKYFDLMNGVFRADKPMHIHFLTSDISLDFATLLAADYSSMHQLALTRQTRIKLLENLIEYYRLHVPEFKGLQSMSILQSLFD
jgi:DNA repair protein RecO (recombination protein O)